jgi:hypothetical protein
MRRSKNHPIVNESPDHQSSIINEPFGPPPACVLKVDAGGAFGVHSSSP